MVLSSSHFLSYSVFFFYKFIDLLYFLFRANPIFILPPLCLDKCFLFSRPIIFHQLQLRMMVEKIKHLQNINTKRLQRPFCSTISRILDLKSKYMYLYIYIFLHHISKYIYTLGCPRVGYFQNSVDPLNTVCLMV